MSPKRRPLNVAALGAAAIPQPDPVHEANRSKAGPTPETSRPTPRLALAPEVPEVVATPDAGGSAAKRAMSREGLVQIQGYYPPETRRRLKVLAAKMGTTQEALLGMALEYLFEKHDR